MASSFLSKIAHRLFDTAKSVDYVLACALGILPAAYAWWTGVARNQTIAWNGSQQQFQGYWHAYNFMMFIVALPLGLYLTRRAAAQVVPVLREQAGDNPPGIIALFPPEGRASAYRALRDAILGPRVIGWALAVTALINIADITAFVPHYVGAFATTPAGVPKGYADWSMMPFFLKDGNPVAGIPLILLAYAGQFCLILLPVLFFIAAIRHNLFFLQSIYQRRCEPAQTPSNSIVINIEDSEKCFGFRTANRAFNAQVAALALCGVIMLGSRIPVVLKAASITGGSGSWFRDVLPNAGQVMLAIGWLAALAVVSMPAIVKMLPMIPKLRGPALERTTATNYLREFLPGLLKPEPSARELDWVASKFSENAFWPTGNNRAKQLFFLSFLVFVILLVPKIPGTPLSIAGGVAALVLLPAGMTALGLFGLRVPLSGIDDRLVNTPATPLPMPDSMKPAKAATAAIPAAMDLQIELSGAGPEYRVTFEWSPPGSNSLRSVTGRAVINPDVLKAITSSAAYGIELGTALFSDPKLRDAWVAANSVTQAEAASLRVRLFIDSEAAALHAVRWETLRDPNGLEQFRGENRWFSRYIASSDDKPAPPRSRDGLKALAVISNPKQLELGRGGLAPIPVADEKQRAREFLSAAGGGDPEILASEGKATLSGIMDRLRAGADILYLICHGMVQDGVPRLLLEKEDQNLDFADANVFVQSLRDLAVPPALIVLASCQSAGSGSTEDATVALGPLLAAAGVPAVIAMQGKVGMDTVAAFMPKFFAELAEHGQVDRAMAVARGHIARRFGDYWMPVLFMRSKDGSVWTADELAPARRAASA